MYSDSEWGFVNKPSAPPKPPPSRGCEGINCRVDAKQPHNATTMNFDENSSIDSRDTTKSSAQPDFIRTKSAECRFKFGNDEFTLKLDKVSIQIFTDKNNIKNMHRGECEKITDSVTKMLEDLRDDSACPQNIREKLKTEIVEFKKVLSEYESIHILTLKYFISCVAKNVMKIFDPAAFSNKGGLTASNNEKLIAIENFINESVLPKFKPLPPSPLKEIPQSQKANFDLKLQFFSGANKEKINFDKVCIDAFIYVNNEKCIDFDAYKKIMDELIKMLDKMLDDLKNDLKNESKYLAVAKPKKELEAKLAEYKLEVSKEEKNSKAVFPLSLKYFLECETGEICKILNKCIFFENGKAVFLGERNKAIARFINEKITTQPTTGPAQVVK
jgi:hypothetical protein